MKYRYLMVIILAVLKQHCLRAECPPQGYDKHSKILVCSEDGLTAIPKDLDQSIEILDFSGNNISHIKNDTFRNMKHVRKISLCYNNISELSPYAWSELKDLEEIDISYNYMSYIPSDAFVHNKKLVKVYLKNNTLSSHGPGPLLRSSSLKYLDLSFCNINSVSKDAFSELPNLEELNMMGNCLEGLDFDTIKPLKKLKKIRLECERCSSPSLQLLCALLENKFIVCSTSQPCNETHPERGNPIGPFEIRTYLLVSGAIISVGITVCVVACLFTFRNKPQNYVTFYCEIPKVIKSLQQRPLPKPPLSNDGYEIPKIPWY